MSSFFTAELLLNKMLFMDYKTLTDFCSTNTAFSIACQDDYFWKMKVERDFGMVTQYKPNNITYRQQYKELMNATDPDKAAGDGRMDLLINFARKDLHPMKGGANLAAENGHLDVLKWLVETFRVYPDIDGALKAAEKGRLDVLQWMAGIEDGYIDEEVVNMAAEYGHLDIVKWIASSKGLYPDEEGIMRAAASGHVELINWVDSMIGFPIF